MPQENYKNYHFADDVMRAILTVEAGGADAAVLSHAHQGEVEAYTVWGAWQGDVFTWRMMAGECFGRPDPHDGVEVFGGHGHDLDATIAAGRVCWECGRIGAGEWSVRLV